MFSDVSMRVIVPFFFFASKKKKRENLRAAAQSGGGCVGKDLPAAQGRPREHL
jgi:hypothetical protein